MTKDIEIKELENGTKISNIEIGVPRSMKNDDDTYSTDFILVRLEGTVATHTVQYCKKGDIIGVKGRIESEPNRICVIAEKVTFLQTGNR